MATRVVPKDATKTVVQTVRGYRIVTFVLGETCYLPTPTFETEAEARAFAAGADWALADERDELELERFD
jgi:hypothetical protein